MNRAFKTFVLWLLLSALPLQGVAAVAKATCGPKHHSLMVADTHDHHHDHGDATPHHHHGDEAELSPAVPEHIDSEPDADVTAKASTCSACAACCTGAAAPPSGIDLMPTLPTSASIAISPAATFIGHIPASLERPPRHSLA